FIQRMNIQHYDKPIFPFFFLTVSRGHTPILFPYTTLFRSLYEDHGDTFAYEQHIYLEKKFVVKGTSKGMTLAQHIDGLYSEKYRSEEHTSELQSRENLVCRLLHEKQNGRSHRQSGENARFA